ncbi:MAG: UvrD-helicase domain-containing protein [Chitinispirillaceae bacterium]|nr:UvrD-helicase domain-containing protein [Chitinispirillaceae bacterium]
MKFYADLHIHSSYSRATSRELTPENLHAWGQIKGLRVIGTGDCLHPEWFAECKKKLRDEGNGLFSLKAEYSRASQKLVPAACASDVRFMLTVEISNIYKRGGRVRKVHNVVCFPSFTAAEKCVTRLERIGNLKSDGRPILGLDSRDLLEIALESDPKAMLIPAHIWTPWFSALGSKSGFDSIEECYGDLTKHIHAVETGLSSDPAMNRRLSSLDPFALVSSSDAHSPSKLGRECTVFETDLSYDGIYRALSGENDAGLAGTIEFFPEEGKYHADGHRKCGVRFLPEETAARKGLCPKCGKPLTVGVLSRVEELADRKAGLKPPRSRPYKSLVPLTEIIGEALDVGPASGRVEESYRTLLSKIGSEFSILLDADLKEIARAGGGLVAEGVRRMRAGEVAIDAGYDGEYGTVKLFTAAELNSIAGQENLFGAAAAQPPAKTRRSAGPVKLKKKAIPGVKELAPHYATVKGSDPVFSRINNAQKEAIVHEGKHLLIVAGPGTGKTHTLTRRIAYQTRRLAGKQLCLALTFTNKAAAEMKERLDAFGKEVSSRTFAGTIHAFCLTVLREHAEAAGLSPAFTVASPEEQELVASGTWPGADASKRRRLYNEVSRFKSRAPGEAVPEAVKEYDHRLLSRGLIDFDTMLQKTYELLSTDPEALETLRQRYLFIFIDEYQDINGIQHALIRLLAGSSGSVTAIGDPHQSIYGFRGSDVRYFESFAQDFPGAQVLALTENYRTAPEIIAAFSQVIAPSLSSVKVPPLSAAVHTRGRLVVCDAPSGAAEAEYVVHQIENLVGGTSMFSHDSGRISRTHDKERGFSDIAVLYRTNSLRRDLEEALSRSGIPFTVTGEKPFHARNAPAALLNLLRFSSGETLAAETLCSLFELTPAQSSFLASFGRADAVIDKNSLSSALSSPDFHRPSLRHAFSTLLNTVNAVADLLAVPDLPQALSIGFTLPAWKKEPFSQPETQEIRERLDRIARLTSSYGEFMDAVLLQREEDGPWGSSEAVSLMTLHASKGLEWPAVFIIGCENGSIPLERRDGLVDGDEERRLLYVGMSRAKELLYLSHAKQRYLHGEQRPRAPSPFLSDIKENLVSHDEGFEPFRKRPDAEQLNLFQK